MDDFIAAIDNWKRENPWFPEQLLPTPNSANPAGQAGDDVNGQPSTGQAPAEQQEQPPQEDPFEWWHQFWREVQKPFQNSDSDGNASNAPFGESARGAPGPQQEKAEPVTLYVHTDALPSALKQEGQLDPDEELGHHSTYSQPENPEAERKRKRMWPSFFLGRKKHGSEAMLPDPKAKGGCEQLLLRKTWVMNMDRSEMTAELTVAKHIPPGMPLFERGHDGLGAQITKLGSFLYRN